MGTNMTWFRRFSKTFAFLYTLDKSSLGIGMVNKWECHQFGLIRNGLIHSHFCSNINSINEGLNLILICKAMIVKLSLFS